MTSVRLEADPAQADAGAGLAVRTWEALCLRAGRGDTRPTGVVRLKRQRRAWHKSAVYQLEGVGDGRSGVVAKRCLRCTGWVEREVYEKLLPRIPVPRVPFYGYVEEEEGAFGWLFMGDASGVKATMADRGVVGEWLAQMHAGAADLPDDVSLPDRGPDYFLGLLPTALAALRTARAVASAAGHDCRVFEDLARALDEVDARWDRVTGACAPWPRTLVHADFSRKHVRLRRDGAGVQVLALDWETAGWGPPAADVAAVPWGRSRRGPGPSPEAAEDRVPWRGPVSLDAYASAIAGRWQGVGRGDVERLSSAGAVFRLIHATCWASQQVQSGAIDKGIGMLRAYADDVAPVIVWLRA